MSNSLGGQASITHTFIIMLAVWHLVDAQSDTAFTTDSSFMLTYSAAVLCFCGGTAEGALSEYPLLKGELTDRTSWTSWYQ